MIGRPISAIMALPTRIGPLTWYLSAIHATPNMTMPAKANGGATRHWAAPTEKPIWLWRISGRKYAMAYVTVVKQLRKPSQ